MVSGASGPSRLSGSDAGLDLPARSRNDRKGGPGHPSGHIVMSQIFEVAREEAM